jgi:hypothetical protein
MPAHLLLAGVTQYQRPKTMMYMELAIVGFISRNKRLPSGLDRLLFKQYDR